MGRLFALALPFLLVTGEQSIAQVLDKPRDLDEAHESLARHLSTKDIARFRAMKSESEVYQVVDIQFLIWFTNECSFGRIRRWHVISKSSVLPNRMIWLGSSQKRIGVSFMDDLSVCRRG